MNKLLKNEFYFVKLSAYNGNVAITWRVMFKSEMITYQEMNYSCLADHNGF